MFASLIPLTAAADPYPPAWGSGSANEAAGPIHFAPVPWPSEPADPVNCTTSCGDWKPYTRFQGDLNDPRVQDPSNGGTAPQNYVNISSSCIDKNYPSIYYHLRKGPASDGSQDVIMFRWRVEQIAHNYATGPSAGSFGATDPWSSGLWTVLFDIDGDGYRDLAAHLNGSSGDPARPIDMIAGIWGKLPTQSVDYLTDPNIKLIAHNPTAFTSGSTILNFHDSLAPDTNWTDVPIASRRSWDYGTSRGKLVYTNSCNEYFVDYQIPVRMLDASSSGPNPSLNGPKITRDTPISMLFCTANSLNNPFQKDCSLNRGFIGDSAKPGPFGDYLSFNKDQPYAQPIVASVTAIAPTTCPGNYTLTAKVQDTLYVDASGVIKPSIKSVRFHYWYDRDGDGTTAGDPGSTWTHAIDGMLSSGTLNTWTASWDASSLPKGKYLIGVQAVDDRTLHDDGVSDAPVDNRTFSYLPGSTASATQAQVYINPWAFDSTTKTWVSSGSGGWVGTGADDQQALFPSHTPAPTPGTTENWYGNPDVTGVQTALIGVAINACGVAPTITKTANTTSVTVGGEVTFTVTVANPASNPNPVGLSEIQDVLPAGFAYKAGSTTGSFTTANPAIAGQTLTWSGSSSLDPGTSASLGFIAIAPTVTGTYSNTASASTDFGPIVSDPVQVGVGAARLTINKSPSTYSAVPGTAITYTLTYSNDSPVNASNVVLSDTIPAGLDYVSCSNGCTCTDTNASGSCNAGDVLSWNIGALASGQGPFTVSYVATVSNPYPNTASVPNVNTATIASSETAPASSSASVFVDTPRPQLTLRKTADKSLVSPAAAAPSNQVIFTLAYANVGNSSATNVVLSDPLPSGFNYVSASPSPSAAPAVGSNGTVTWNLGTLAAGATGSVTVTAQSTNPYTGSANPAVNVASIASTETAAVTDTAEVGILQSGQVCSTYYFRDETGAVGVDGTQKLATISPVPLASDTGGSTTITVPGGSNTYSTTVLSFYQSPAATADTTFAGNLTTNMYMDRNAGPGITIRTTVYDYNSTTGSRTQIGQSTQSFTGSSTGLLTFTVPLSGTLSKNHRLLWTYAVTSNNTQSTPLLFQYDGTVPNSLSDTSPPIATTFANSRADYCVTPPANLVLEKSASAASVDVAGSGRTLTYTLSYTNTSSATAATNAVLTDTLPAGTTFASATGGGTHNGATPGVVTWNLGTVAAGASASVTVTVNVANDLTGITSLVNSAQLQSDQTAAVSATATTAVIGGGDPSGEANVIVTKRASSSLLVPGNVVTYTLTVLNAGTKPASAITLTDALPVTSYFTYVENSTRLNGTLVAPDPETAGNLSVNVGSLAPGATATVTFDMLVASTGAPDGVSTVSNTASVSYTGCASAPCTSTSDQVSVLSISTNPNLSLAKAASIPVAPATSFSAGDIVTYTLTLTNTGSGAATDVVVRDPIPGRMRFAGSLSATDNDAANGAWTSTFDAVNNRVVYSVGSLGAGKQATLSFQAAIDSALPNGTTTLSNTATASASNASTRTATADTTANAGPILSVNKTGPANVPYPAATLTSAASAATQIFVTSSSAFSVGQYVRIDTTIARITAIAGNTLTVSTPVTAASGAAVIAGASYALTYQNSGTADAAGVIVSDALPSGWLYVASTPEATSAPSAGSNGTVAWSIGTVAAGTSATLQLIAIPTTSGLHTNTAVIADSVYCSGAAPPSSCSSSVATAVGGLSVTKSTSTPNVVAGGTATWTISVNNSLGSPVTGVDVSDVLPAGYSYGSTNSIIAPGATRTSSIDPTAGDIQPRWGNWTLPANGTLTLVFTANIAANVGPATYQNETSITTTTSTAGITPFDALATPAEDTTVLAPGTGLVQGVVYRDANANGVFDAGIDSPLPGVTVTLIDSTGTTFTVHTDASGYFSRVVATGSTIVDVDNGTLPSGLVLTSGTDGSDPSTVTVPDGGTASRNTGFVPASGPVGNVAGNVWIDANRSSVKDAGEANQLGVAVELRDAATNSLIATAYTDVLGNYSFPNTPLGNYYVVPVAPGGYLLTTANVPTSVSVTSGATATANFGLATGITLAGTVFRDNGSGGGTAADGLRNGSEPGTNAGGLNVVIVDSANTVLAVASVGAGGSWSATVAGGTGYAAYLSTATPGIGSSVTPAASLPASWSVTRESLAGTVDPTADGMQSGISATSNVSGIDFGIDSASPTYSVSGLVFGDIDGSGLRNGGESGTSAGGLHALLVDGSGNLVATTPVAANGSWSFAGVSDGTYTVRLSTVAGNVGTAAPSASLQPGWFATGESVDGSTPDGSADASLVITVNGADITTPTQGLRQRADVIVQKNGPGTISASGTAVYTIRIDNAGPGSGDGTVVTDNLPAGATAMSWTCGATTGGAACPNGAGSGGINETIATLPAGGSLTYTVSMTAPASGAIANSASATLPAGVVDTNITNNTSAVTSVVGTPGTTADLAVVKHGPASVAPSGSVTYTIVVTNAGPAAADGAVFADDATAAGLTSVNWTCGNATGGALCPNGNGINAINQTIAAFPAGASLTYTVTGTAPASGTLTNSASITPPAGLTDPQTADNVSTAATSISATSGAADLSVAKTGPATVAASGTLTYHLVVSNGGSDAASGVHVVDTVPAALANVSWACGNATGGGACATASGSGAAVDVPVDLPAGATVTITITGTAPASAASFANSARVVAPSGLADPDPTNDVGGPVITHVVTVPDVYAQVSAPATATVGSTVNATVTFGNQGAASAAGIVYAIQLPAGLSGVACTGATCSYDPTGGSTTVSGLASTLLIGQSVAITLSYTSPAPAGSTVSITATVTTTTPGETPTTNNSAVGSTTSSAVAALADAAASISAPATAVAGSAVSVSILFSNVGASATTGTTYALSGLPAGAVVRLGGTVCSWNSGTGALTGCSLPASLTSGQSVSLVATYTAPASGTITAIATVGATNDPNGSNDTASASTTVIASPPPPTPLRPAPIPTLSEWGVILLSLAIALSGLLQVGRSRPRSFGGNARN